MRRISPASPASHVKAPKFILRVGDDSIVCRLPTPARLMKIQYPMQDMQERLADALVRYAAAVEAGDQDLERAVKKEMLQIHQWGEGAVGWLCLRLVCDPSWEIEAMALEEAKAHESDPYPELQYGQVFYDELHELSGDVMTVVNSVIEKLRKRPQVLAEVSETAAFTSAPTG